MASFTRNASLLRQASRLASHPSAPAAALRRLHSAPTTRIAASASSASTNSSVSPVSRTQRRSYVTESKRDNAQVADPPKIETAIHLDKKDFQNALSDQGASVSVSPMADVLKQATLLDEGQRPIYLDMQATTPVDPRVLDAMLPYYVGIYGNPHSRTHSYGWESEQAVDTAREHVARLIGADPKEIIFTSGATESNNMSIKGVARFFGRSGKKKHIITTQTEHKCVLDSCRHLSDEGFDITYLPVLPSGLIDMAALEAAIRPDTAIVSIMAVNNEIGVIQPLAEIGKLCRKNKVFFHTDGAQAVGKIPLDVNAMNIDLMSISSHKIYGPMGIGACYVRRRPRVRLDPIDRKSVV